MKVFTQNPLLAHFRQGLPVRSRARSPALIAPWFAFGPSLCVATVPVPGMALMVVGLPSAPPLSLRVSVRTAGHLNHIERGTDPTKTDLQFLSLLWSRSALGLGAVVHAFAEFSLDPRLWCRQTFLICLDGRSSNDLWRAWCR